MVEVGTGTATSRFLKTDYPIEEGLEAGTQKQTGRDTQLEAEESVVLDREKELL